MRIRTRSNRRLPRHRAPALSPCAVLLALLFTVLPGLGLEWSAEPVGKSAPLQVSSTGKSGFELFSPDRTGVTFTNTLSREHAAENQIRLNGSGVAAGDVDGDGWCDLFFCSLEGGNHLFRNLGGWRFQEVTAEAGLQFPAPYSTGAALADLDGDGDLDLLVNGIGSGTRCFLNNGSGHFEPQPASGLVPRFGSMSLALGDVDGDGDLDLYVANYQTRTIRSTGFAVMNVGGKRSVLPEDRDRLEFTPEGTILEHGERDFLYLNNGQGKFQPVSWTNSLWLDETGAPLTRVPRDWGLTAAFRDLNGDLAPDLYVANDFHSPDRVWLNDGHGRFRALPTLAVRHTPTFSMAVDFADIDRDGHDDFIALDMLERTHAQRLQNLAMNPPNPPALGEGVDRPQIDRNVLQWNRGDGTYADVAQYAGIEATGWSWSVLFLDVDLDGYEDLLFTTGNLFNTQDLDANARIAAHGPFRREEIPTKLFMYPPLFQPKIAFRNRGDLSFEPAGAAWGFDQAGVAQGMALADLDNDGDLDVVVNNLNAPAGLYRNNSPAPRVLIRLKGLAPNTRGIGAKIHLLGGPVPQSQEMSAAGRYLSCDDSARAFATGSSASNLTIRVDWRSGRQTTLSNASPNRVYQLDEALSTPPAPARVTLTNAAPLFVDVSAQLNHVHQETPFDDFARQPLLPHKLSQIGPGVAWCDFDGDGWEDLVIGSGKGGRLALFQNDQHGGFRATALPLLSLPVARDQTGLVSFPDENGRTELIAGSANYEDGLAVGSCARQYRQGANQIIDSLPGQSSSTGPLALGDLDADGALDLFVGGRVVPGRYPEPATSLLFRRQNGQWILNDKDSRPLRGVGLVTGALWSDLDNDSFPELVLASEWGPIRVFARRQSVLVETTAEWGLDRWTGWWNGVTAGDFDGDGQLDLVASNWGLNSSYRATPAHPCRVYYGAFGGTSLDILESAFDESLQKWVPERDLNAVAAALPYLREQFPTHQSYSTASIEELLGNRTSTAKILNANTLASTVFLNRRGRFEAVPLPLPAQITPAFGVTVADFDGDGKEDLFLAQNLFAAGEHIPRQDAGRGLVLLGDGTGHFKPLPGDQSGLMIYGEQRGCASADFNQDGRVDLAVTQNAAPTRLFVNKFAKPGLRVRLAGPPGNPRGIGATLRLKSSAGFGPRRELHAGSGYLSQDSDVPVLSAAGESHELEVRFPGGKPRLVPIPPGAKEIHVNASGQVLE